jgi:MFS family permease
LGRSLVPLVASLTAASMLGTMGTTVLASIAPEAARAFGVPAAMIGYQFSLMVGAMLASLAFLSNASRRWGACRTIQAGVAITGASLVLVLVPDLACLAVGTLGMGAGHGLLMPAISHLLVRFTPPDRLNLVFSVQQAGIPLGSILAAAAGPMLTVWVGWQAAIAVAAAGLLALAFAMQPWRAQWDDDRDAKARIGRNPVAGLRMVAQSDTLAPLALAGACFSAAQFCVATYTVVTLVEQLGFGLVEAGLVLTVAQALGVLSRIACGWIADRHDNALAVLTTLAGAITAVAAAALALSPDWPRPLVWALFAALGTATIGWPGVCFALIGRLAPEGQVPTSTGGVLVYTNVGKLLGPMAFAAIYTGAAGAAAGFGALVVPGVLATIALVRASRKAGCAARVLRDGKLSGR